MKNNERINFDLFRSNIHHTIKNTGDLNYIKEILLSDKINIFYENKWYLESLYLLATLDYLSKCNNIPLCNKYDNLRLLKMNNTIFPSEIALLTKLFENNEHKNKCLTIAIPEYLKFNIVECDIRNAC